MDGFMADRDVLLGLVERALDGLGIEVVDRPDAPILADGMACGAGDAITGRVGLCACPVLVVSGGVQNLRLSLGIFKEGQLVGLAGLELRFERPKSGGARVRVLVRSLFVDARYRGRSFGSLLAQGIEGAVCGFVAGFGRALAGESGSLAPVSLVLEYQVRSGMGDTVMGIVARALDALAQDPDGTLDAWGQDIDVMGLDEMVMDFVDAGR